MAERVCDRCQKPYKDIFDTIVRIDYMEPGKGKPYEYHFCMSCRKTLVNWCEQDEKF